MDIKQLSSGSVQTLLERVIREGTKINTFNYLLVKMSVKNTAIHQALLTLR